MSEFLREWGNLMRLLGRAGGSFLARWFLGSGEVEEKSGIYLDGIADGFLVHVAFGPACDPVGSGAEAFLPGVSSLASIVEIVQFAALKRLPVDGWIISGFSHAPYSVRELAGWLAQLSDLGAPGRLIVQTSGLSASHRNRLLHELSRRGCRLH